MELQDVIKYLFDNSYLKVDKGIPSLTSKFKKNLDTLSKHHTFTPLSKPNEVPTELLPVPQDFGRIKLNIDKISLQDWTTKYQQFILDAKIPARLEGKPGEFYSTNKYSEDGMKAFQKAMKGGCEYKLLVASVTLYYKSGIRFKKAIGTYMTSGEWRSDYEGLKESAKDGTIIDHIQQQRDNHGGTTSRYELG